MAALFVTALLIITISHNLYNRLFSRRSLPKSLPWIGVDDGLFSRARTTVRTFFHTRDLVLEGYEKYSKKNLPFVLPNVTTGPEVILPMSQMEWLLHQPDNILSQNEVNRQFLQADYTMLHPRVVTDTVHDDVIRKELTKLLGEYTEDVQDEIDFAFRKVWGVNTNDWLEVPAYHTMLDVIGRISNRVLVGLPLCRDEAYLKPSKEFARLVVVQGTFISLFPPIFKPNSAPIGDEKKKNDYVQWCIDHSHRKNDPSERTPDIISRRLNVVVLAELTAERGIWSKSALARMVTLDSTLRESLRMWGFVSRGVLKEVNKKDGVTLPSGQHLPRGTKVGIHAYPVHHDEDYYKDPYTFNPMRFCTQGEKLGDGPAYSGKNKGTALVTTSSAFMPFSHGRHAWYVLNHCHDSLLTNTS
ncbi:putative Ent-kaurene oxidase [Cadophora sp. DSE1049]|nr:putative Ent-kaurene oxidase [Cadophora sp. DSE1049]